MLPNGFSVGKGNMVFYAPYAMGWMERVWGDDVQVFRPERWLDEHSVFQPESPFKFTAFEASPRICVGKEFTYRQMKIFALGFLLSVAAVSVVASFQPAISSAETQ